MSFYFSPIRRVALTITGVSLGELTFPPILTYTDAALSGTPRLLRFLYLGNYYYVKAYPTIGAEAGGSGDDAASNLYLADDAALSGYPFVFNVLTTIGGVQYVEYYFKAYPTAAADVNPVGELSRFPEKYPDSAISGTPRVAKTLIGATPYYWKVYPTKA
jgi:hypothetical protein